MKIAIIGAGFTGLSLAYDLLGEKHKVDIFEQSERLGGLASGFKVGDWHLDRFYHHIFSSDKDILDFAKKIDFKDWVWKNDNNTATYINKQIYSFSSALDLLSFKPISFLSRLQTGIFSLYLKMKNNPQGLENISANNWIKKYMGNQSYQAIWKPLLLKKFSRFYDKIIMSWLWARIYKRTNALGYPSGGFENLACKASEKIKARGGRIFLKKKINDINLLFKNYDRVIYTGPSNLLPLINKKLPKQYLKECRQKEQLTAFTLLILYKENILSNYYWLNINSKKPRNLVCVVNHTAFIDKKNYADKQVIYMGGYFEKNNKLLNNPGELKKEWLSFLKKIAPDFDLKKVSEILLFKADNSQPIMNVLYKKNILPFAAPEKKLFMVNMDQIYPYDRGINYAIALANQFLKKHAKDFAI